jgi:RNA ligase (TIGR02306 family)
MDYARNVDHCSPTKYVRNVTIKAVLPAANSDNLERIIFEEIGWESIARKGQYRVGESVFFIPPESVLPFPLSEALGVTQYLGNGKVKVVRLRGNRSEGLIVDKSIAEPYLPYIMQWEDVPNIAMKGEQMSFAEIPTLDFQEFYKIPNLLNEPDIFQDDEPIYVSEKIHGTNVRFGVHENPKTGEPQLYVGGHRHVLRETEQNLYWKVVRKHTKWIALPQGVTFYGEIFGRGIQDLHYCRTDALRIFATTENGKYHGVDTTVRLCETTGLEAVSFDLVRFQGIEHMRRLADQPSSIVDSHVREGIVIRESQGEFRAAKVIGMPYLTRGGKKTERH